MRWAPSFVTVVTTTVGLAACDSGNGDMRTANPPAPPPPETASTAEPTAVVATNPPAPLPKWDEVPSGHPEGATNPPSPVLQLHPDGRCFKSWEGGMSGPPRGVSAQKVGGKTFQVRILDDSDSDVRGKQIVCPDGAADVLNTAKQADGAAAPKDE